MLHSHGSHLPPPLTYTWILLITSNLWKPTHISPYSSILDSWIVWLILEWVVIGGFWIQSLGFVGSSGFTQNLWGRDFELSLCVYVLIWCPNSYFIIHDSFLFETWTNWKSCTVNPSATGSPFWALLIAFHQNRKCCVFLLVSPFFLLPIPGLTGTPFSLLPVPFVQNRQLGLSLDLVSSIRVVYTKWRFNSNLSKNVSTGRRCS